MSALPTLGPTSASLNAPYPRPALARTRCLKLTSSKLNFQKGSQYSGFLPYLKPEIDAARHTFCTQSANVCSMADYLHLEQLSSTLAHGNEFLLGLRLSGTDGVAAAR